jgi:hypothetical protein
MLDDGSAYKSASLLVSPATTARPAPESPRHGLDGRVEREDARPARSPRARAPHGSGVEPRAEPAPLPLRVGRQSDRECGGDAPVRRALEKAIDPVSRKRRASGASASPPSSFSRRGQTAGGA